MRKFLDQIEPILNFCLTNLPRLEVLKLRNHYSNSVPKLFQTSLNLNNLKITNLVYFRGNLHQLLSFLSHYAPQLCEIRLPISHLDKENLTSFLTTLFPFPNLVIFYCKVLLLSAYAHLLKQSPKLHTVGLFQPRDKDFSEFKEQFKFDRCLVNVSEPFESLS